MKKNWERGEGGSGASPRAGVDKGREGEVMDGRGEA